MPGHKGLRLLVRHAAPGTAVSHREARVRFAPAILAGLLMAGCSGVPGFDPGATTSAQPAVPAVADVPQDPLLAFVASASPGSQGFVNGERIRIARAYSAASGRDCRELLIGGGLGERSAVACRDDVAGWTLTRPLLRGSGLGRP